MSKSRSLLEDGYDMTEVFEEPPVPSAPFNETEELEVYSRHWAPLLPPPYHHPWYYPTEAQLQEVQRLDDNYTRYWRTLPKFAQLTPLLEVDAQAQPYFKYRNWTYAWRSRPEVGVNDTLLFVCHHKTGVTLRYNLQQELQNYFEIWEAYEPIGFGDDGWPMDIKTIHFVRDPVDTILSAYRYHVNRWGSETWSWGHGKLQDPQCFECDDEDHAAIFQTCNMNCTYFELLNRLNETQGVLTEAVSSRFSVQSMALFLAYQASNPNTLRVSFDLFKADYNQTIACILKFLGREDDQGLQERLVAAAKRVHDPYHITTGHYNNTALKAFLRSHPTWGPDFQQVNDLILDLLNRQSAIWGCPYLGPVLPSTTNVTDASGSGSSTVRGPASGGSLLKGAGQALQSCTLACMLAVFAFACTLGR